jgi:hypothetical protein
MEGHQLKKGQVANPNGRPKGFAAQIQRLCGKDYQKIAEAYAVIAFGTTKQCTEISGEPIRRTVKDRLTALTELRDRGPGCPSQALAHSVPDGGDIVIRWQS